MKKLTSIQAKHKLLLGYGLITAILLATLFFYLHPLVSKNIDHLKKSRVRATTEIGYALLEHYHQQYTQGVYTEKEARQLALEALKVIRSMDQEYYWVNNYQGRLLMHPFAHHLVGEELIYFEDPAGTRLFEEFAHIVKTQNGGFVHYEWEKPGETTPQPKISYVKGFEPWQMIIGSGIYIDDINRVKKRIFWSFLVVFIFMLTLIIAIFLYISDRRQEEMTLRASEAKYKRLAENSPAVVYQLKMDADQRFSFPYITDNVEQVAGISSREVMQNPGALHDNIHKDDRQQHDEATMESARNLSTFHCIFRQKKNDDYIWIEARSTPEKMPDGSILWDGFLMDITQRKKEKDSLQLTQFVIDRAIDSVFWVDENGGLVYANDSACRSLGYTRKELLSKTIFDIDPDFPEEGFKEHKRLLKKQGAMTFESRHITKQGHIYPVEVSTNYFEFENRWFACAFTRNTSQRKKAEQALRESEEKLRALFTCMTEIVVLHELVFDHHGTPVDYRITDCNEAFTQRTGITSQMAVGNLASEVYNSKPPPYFDTYCKVALTGEPIIFETYYAPMDKHLSISVVSPGKNRFATVTTDISEIRQAQQLIAAKNKELEQIIYVASHDLRSPLVNVDGYSQELDFLLQKLNTDVSNRGFSHMDIQRLFDEVLPEMQESLRHIKTSTREMDTLLKGLLKLSRTGRALVNIEEVDTNKLLQKVLISLEYQVKKTNAQIHCNPLPPCRGDYIQLHQVFSNLIGNALKYQHPERQPQITISAQMQKEQVIYCVADNGIGIAPQHQKIIFEIFHRLHPEANEGEGLGLTIVKQILERLNGEITVESAPNQGSRFFVSLPSVNNFVSPNEN